MSSWAAHKFVEGDNILRFDLKRDLSGLKNKVTVKGAFIGGRQITYTAKDDLSILRFGEREKVIVDPTITDLSYAEALATQELEKSKDVELIGNVDAVLKFCRAGEYAHIKIDSLGIDEIRMLEKIMLQGTNKLTMRIEFRGKTKSLSDIIAEIYDKTHKIERSSEALKEATFAALYVEPVFCELTFHGPDFKESSNVWFDENGNLKLVDGALNGYAVFEVNADEEAFLNWFDLNFDVDEKDGSITVDILDAADNVIESNISSYKSLQPYPADLDACENNANEYDVVNGFVDNSHLSAVSAYSIKVKWQTGLDRYVIYPKSKSLGLNCLFYKYLHIYILQGSTQPVKIRLHTTDNDYYEKTLLFPQSYVWREFKLELGTSDWAAVGSPDWSNINFISIYLPASDNITEYTWIDGICFYPLLAETFKVKFNFSRPNTSSQSPVFKKLVVRYLLGVV